MLSTSSLVIPICIRAISSDDIKPSFGAGAGLGVAITTGVGVAVTTGVGVVVGVVNHLLYGVLVAVRHTAHQG